MKIKINKVHCLFEQSGTFKNEWIRLGYPAVDYDIQNEYKQTDVVIDLFVKIERAYNGESSIFDGITADDLVMAFFPCVYFEALQMTFYTNTCNNNRNTGKKKFDVILDRIDRRNHFYKILYKLIAVCEIRGFRLIIENPATKPSYILFSENFYIPPTFIDKDRTLRGDYFKKPTAYWFIGLKPTSGASFVKRETKTVRGSNKSKTPGMCSKERSEISPIYARNFICDFILGQENEYTQKTLF